MRITLVISSMARGGAERVVSVLVNAWAEQGKQVTLLTFDRGNSSTYPLHQSVNQHGLGLEALSTHFLERLLRNLKRILVLRYAIRDSKPDVVISFMNQTNVLSILASLGMNFPVIINEQSDSSLYDTQRSWRILRRLVYPRASALVCPATGLLARYLSMVKVRGCLIPNPISFSNGSSPRPQANAGEEARTLMAMGRLVPEKGFDLLLNAFSQVACRHPNWSLKIIGEGPLRGQLENLAESLNLTKRVQFLGELVDPFPVLRTADLFVFSSRSEGFGLALAEAMACGLPSVSFNCPYGPADIVRDGVDGILVPAEDIAALAAALDRLMDNANERERLAMRAPEVITRFGKQRILLLWQELFERL